MTICKTKNELFDFLKTYRNSGKLIGFVPTMGALHQGHISLIEKSINDNDCTVVSIFVNPEQFNNKSDFDKYPNMLEADIEKLKKNGCDAVFMPSMKEVYPEKDNRVFDLYNLDKYMEGVFRPGHFEGVVKVVSILLEIVLPNNTYFGEKDFQQLSIIKFAVKKYFPNLKTNITACPILREPDGLAMSSRNLRLNTEQRKAGAEIYKAMNAVKKIECKTLKRLKSFVINKINESDYLNVEYFEVVNPETLQPISELKKGEKYRACVAVFAGEVRLIDNIEIYD